MSHTYPPIQAYHSEMLDVGQGQQIYLEQTGNPSGIPVLYLHGGPGGGLCSFYRSFFDPQKYRIIGFDQRGCGQSLPFADLNHNTTQDLLEDIETVRHHLGIKKWVLVGGSWGATLALLAAIKHPKTVRAVILRGTFLARQEDFDWYLAADGGAAQLFPEHYQQFTDLIQDRLAHESLLDAYYHIFTQGDELSRLAAAKAWCLWEERISLLNTSVNEQDLCQNLHRAHSLAVLECHYLKHGCFIEENYILANVKKISHIPATFIHGRYDVVCKLEAAHSLRQRWRNSQLLIVPEAGHSASDPNIAEAICHATDAMARFIQEEKS